MTQADAAELPSQSDEDLHILYGIDEETGVSISQENPVLMQLDEKTGLFVLSGEYEQPSQTENDGATEIFIPSEEDRCMEMRPVPPPVICR